MRKIMTYRRTVVKIDIFCLIFFRKVRQKMAGFGTMEQIVKNMPQILQKEDRFVKVLFITIHFSPK